MDNQKMVSGYGQYHTDETNKPSRRAYVQISLDEIRNMVDNPPNTQKSEGRWFIPSSLMSRTFKQQEANGEYFCLWADFDKEPRPILEIYEAWNGMSGGCDAELYSSRSATKNNQKSRIIIPLSLPLSGTDWMICQQILNAKMTAGGFVADTSSERAAQLCYLPNRGDFYESLSERNNNLFNPLEVWSTEIARQREQIAQAKQDAEARSKAREAQREQRKAKGYESHIEAFNAAYTVEDVLERGDYDTDSKGNWRHPNSESGNYSASVKDGRVFSLSSSDPLYTGGPGNGAHDAYSGFTVLFGGGNPSVAQKIALSDWLEGWQIASAKADFDDLSEDFDIREYFRDLTLTAEDVDKMSEAEFLIKDVIVRGHVSVFIAPGNGGKTTLFVHFCEQLAAMGMTVMYVNVDGSPGDLKRHYAHADKFGYAVIVPDAKCGKSTDDVMHKLQSLARSPNQLDNVVIIIDTLKKFVDVIAKGASKDFYKMMRTLTVKGATVCLLGHANKYKDENGRHVFEGTADLRNDLDEMIYLTSVELQNPKRLQITTDPDKKRAEFKPRSYTIYLEDDRRVEECTEVVEIKSPETMLLIGLIRDAINTGNSSQKDIVSFVVERSAHGLKKVKQVLHENTGPGQVFISRLTGRAKDLAYALREAVEDFSEGQSDDFEV